MMAILHDIQLRRRVLFVLGNLAACAVIAGALVIPTIAFFADRDGHISDQLKVLARLSAVAAQAGNVQSIVSDASVQMRGGEFLAGPNENVISADLQTRLKAITEAAGARSRAVQALPMKTSDQIKYSGSRIEIFGPLPSIHRAIHAIESAKPYLFITGAVIKGLPPASRQGVPEEPVMQAQLDIFGAIHVNGREP
ncbi:MAG TPA: type II secretion system protein GspM [Bradyrhizobium sp.]|nr:type II secretion system protein GspM [Bradyrhizobium sp.]